MKKKVIKKNLASAVFEMEELLPFCVEDQMLKKKSVQLCLLTIQVKAGSLFEDTK